jgi:hypothetical protein
MMDRAEAWGRVVLALDRRVESTGLSDDDLPAVERSEMESESSYLNAQLLTDKNVAD